MQRYPVQVRARHDEPMSRWLWLVKWVLLVPHFVVLAVLWVAFVALTLIAYVAVLFTGRYPRAVFEFNVGVLRWTWRVGFYGYQVLGTDRYPPFSLAEVPDYPAGLLVDGPARLPRWLPLVAWLLAVPHILILGALTGAVVWPWSGNQAGLASLDLVGVGVLIVAISLAVRGRAPQGLYDLLVGVARWSLRVGAYVALLTGAYPPFRLDQGDIEPGSDPSGPVSSPDTAAALPASGSGGRGVGRVVALVAGVFLLVTSIGVGFGGGGLLVLGANRDGEGFVTSPALDIASSTSAVTAEGIEILIDDGGSGGSAALGGYGQVRINVSSTTSTPVFVGIAKQSDVDTWLAGVAHDRLASAYGMRGTRLDRTAGPIGDVNAPTDQSFWLASATGTTNVVLNWQVSDGRFAIVVANATGAHGVAAAARIATRIPPPAPLGAGLLSGALLLAIVAFALIYLGAAGLAPRRAGPPHRTPSGSTDPTGPHQDGENT